MIITDGAMIAGISYAVNNDGFEEDFTNDTLDDILTAPVFKGTVKTRVVEDVDYCIDNLKEIVEQNNKYWEAENYDARAHASYKVIDLAEVTSIAEAESDLIDLGY